MPAAMVLRKISTISRCRSRMRVSPFFSPPPIGRVAVAGKGVDGGPREQRAVLGWSDPRRSVYFVCEGSFRRRAGSIGKQPKPLFLDSVLHVTTSAKQRIPAPSSTSRSSRFPASDVILPPLARISHQLPTAADDAPCRAAFCRRPSGVAKHHRQRVAHGLLLRMRPVLTPLPAAVARLGVLSPPTAAQGGRRLA